MTFVDIIEHLPAHIINKGTDFSDKPIEHVVASDLMSDVLVVDLDNTLIVTSLASEQTVRTADIVGARGVLLVNDKNPQPAMKKLAEEQNITVLSTPLSMFQACVALGKLMEAGAQP
ncbi:DRTGG domain-containing protein [Gracilinema caldarium]|uniref:DRTGG domain-containing protein n=1 Tax=Gracilinema caldarium TaxID=215591 RepID=UPI0026F11732|nr:DRTGG domain-containing protein [Gracilinema caldarium]